MKKIFLYVGFFIYCNIANANTTSEKNTATYFKSIQDDPEKILIFLQNMPKGGDLHYHGGGGSSSAENLMRYGIHGQFCINPQTFVTFKDDHCSSDNRLDLIPSNTIFYNKIINAWSMRDFHPTMESAHDHFFAAFAKFDNLAAAHNAEILSETANRAGVQNISYIELMTVPDRNASGLLGNKIGWDEDFALLRQKLLSAGLSDIVANMQKDITDIEVKKQNILACNTSAAEPGCEVKIYYQYVALREQSPANIFAELLAAFEIVSKDPRFVGVNLAQPEDGYISMRDYHLQMQMIAFLHKIYPNVHISLHAGELHSMLVPADGLQFHIRDAIETAHAERIGHGVAVTMEKNADELLKKMAAEQVMVEINLSSNQAILDITGKQHPLPLYLSYHVPVALSTDDEGILRTTLTLEYQKAVLTYHLDYLTLKQMVRNSIYYSFIPGKNLWMDNQYQTINEACAKDVLRIVPTSKNCQHFLSTNEKAHVQWDLEKRFDDFENSAVIPVY
ncbi:MAG TPA: adenosine deaminase [Gammaproteobacteria bacterium]|jgi:adenosine deaminase|nr:adenosine deaminase [Gammaproteobacteria bacterium]